MAASSASASSAFTRGLVVVAALGSVDDLPLLASNMLHFPRASWDCVALSYRRLPPAGRCEYIHREGWLWGSLLNLTTAHVTAGYSHVFVLLDDLALPKASFNLSELLWVQQRSGLVAVSPTVAGASRGSMSPTQVAKWRGVPGRVCVHRVRVIELFATLFTEPAWRCFHSLFDDRALHNNTHAVAWGYDLCFQAKCADTLDGAPMGIVVDQMAVHVEGPVSEVHAHVENKVRAEQGIDRVSHDVGGRGWSTLWSTNTSLQLRAMVSRLAALRKAHKDHMLVAAGYESEFRMLARRTRAGRTDKAHVEEEAKADMRRVREPKGVAGGDRANAPIGRRLALRQHGKTSLGLDQAYAVRRFVWRMTRRNCPLATRRMPTQFHYPVSCDFDL